MPEIITKSTELFALRGQPTMFYIVEYYDKDTHSAERYDLLRNEIIKHPATYTERLDSGIYKIWTTTPH